MLLLLFLLIKKAFHWSREQVAMMGPTKLCCDLVQLEFQKQTSFPSWIGHLNLSFWTTRRSKPDWQFGSNCVLQILIGLSKSKQLYSFGWKRTWDNELKHRRCFVQGFVGRNKAGTQFWGCKIDWITLDLQDRREIHCWVSEACLTRS